LPETSISTKEQPLTPDQERKLHDICCGRIQGAKELLAHHGESLSPEGQKRLGDIAAGAQIA